MTNIPPASNTDSQAQRQDPEGYVLGKNSQCWKDLKAKTRFTSYNDHVKAYKHRDRLWFWNSLYDLEKDLDESVKRYFSQRPDPSLCPSNCFMIDLFKSTDLAVNLRQRWVGSSGTEILEALQNPPRDACVQVFIWHIMRDIGISPPLVDAFGLGLGISPQFFKALYLLLKGKPLEQDLTKHEIELRPLRSDFVVIGNAVITISRYQPSETNSVPVVLIAGNWIPDERRWSVSDCVDQDLRETPALQPPVGENLHRGMLSLALQAHIAGRISQRVYDDIKDGCWGYSYFELLKVLLKRDDIRGKSGDTLSFVVLLPLMQLDVLWIRRSCRLLRLILPNAGSERGVDIARIHADRRSLRRSVENVEDSLDHLTMHSTWPNLKAWLREPVYQDVEQQMRQCFRQARRLEAEARDYLQLEAGLLALRESQTSIELSNQQIQEGKRLKIFTVLAFVYVPLNLATSIFGMNLQELNQNGQQLWVFMTTAVTVLIITTGSWFFLEQVNNYKIWRRGAREKPSRHRRGTKWALAKRVAMLVWLLENGHRSWMQTSGAWWRILVNDETAVSDWSTLSSYSPDGHTEVSRMTAGDYVTKFSATQIPGFNPFDPKHFPKDEIDFRVIGPHYAISRLFIRFFPIRSLRNAWRRRRE